MATQLSIKESSFRIGSGRYIQDSGCIARLAEEIKRLGCSRPFVIGSSTALSLARPAMEASLDAAGLHAVWHTYAGFCCEARLNEIMAADEFRAADIVIGVGGGNCMDAAKFCAASSRRPVINVPTSSATCAAFTPLSVMYTPEGRTAGTNHLGEEVNCVLADMDILCRQPVRLLVSGIYDSLAKLIETTQRLQGRTEDETDIGLLSSFALSRFSYDWMLRHLTECTDDVAQGRNSKVVYDMVYILIALTGVISGLARGSNQCAIAHKVYETTRTIRPEEAKPWLHGELVGIGLLAQLIYNSEPEASARFAEQMTALGMPIRLSHCVPMTDADLDAMFEKICASTAMAGTGEAEKVRLRDALEQIR